MKVYEGTIISCDRNNSVFHFLVEDEGRIIFVGNDLPERFKNVDRVLLQEGALLPSFVDSHIHFASFALFNAGLNVMGAESNEELLQMLSRHVSITKASIVIAFGASPHSVKERKLVNREELDKVSRTHPVFIVKYDGHACIINSALIKQLPPHIAKLRGYNVSTGEMNQEAFFAVTDYVTGRVSLPTLVKNMQKAIDYLAAKGIGMAHTVSGVGFPKDMDVDMERWVGRACEGGFQLRVFFQTMDLHKVVKRKLPRIGGCFKTALDGCFGSVDAALLRPYQDSEDQGVLYYTDEEVKTFCMNANRNQLQIEMHAIGDRAFNQAVNALVAALIESPREDHRHGIIHACLPTKEGLEKCAKYGIQLAMQTAFVDWKQEPGWYLNTVLGEREKLLNPIAEIHRMGIRISLGSDGPCTDPDPIMWIYNACNHPIESQRVSVYDALRMVTYQGYCGTFDEKERGSLETGKIADMVILDENPLEIEQSRIKEIKVKSLILNGKTYAGQKQHWIWMILKGILKKQKI